MTRREPHATSSSRSAPRSCRRRRSTGRSSSSQVRVPKALERRAPRVRRGRAYSGRPRRLVVLVSELAERQDDRIVRAQGPGGEGGVRRRGQAHEGRAMGFARGKGVDGRATSRSSRTRTGAYVYAVVERARPARRSRCCPTCSARLPTSIEWPKSHAVGKRRRALLRARCAGCSRSSAPTSCRCEFAGLTAAASTVRPPLPRARARSRCPTRSEYALALRAREGRRRPGRRARELIREGIEHAQARSAAARAVVPEKTFAEVVNLVEWPTVAVGHVRRGVPRGAARGARERDGESPALLPGGARATARSPTASSSCTTATRSAPRQIVARPRARHPRAARRRRVLLPRGPRTSARGRAWPQLDTIVFQERLGTLGDKVGARRAPRRARSRSWSGAAPTRRRSPRAPRTCAKADLVTTSSSSSRRCRASWAATTRWRRARSRRSPTRSSSTTSRASPATSCPPTRRGPLVAVADKLDTIVGHLRHRAWRRPARPTRTRCAAARSASCR